MNILISSAGRRVGLVHIFREALQALGVQGKVFAADMTPLSSAFHAADQGFVVPRCTADNYITSILAICEQHAIGLIVPTIDTELPVYTAHRERLAEAGVTVAVSSPEVIAISGDKVSTHEWLVSQGLPTVRQVAIDEALQSIESWQPPFIVKPRAGSASIGVEQISSIERLHALASQTDLIVQSLAPGQEYTTDIWIDKQGECRCAIPRQRLEVRAGEVSKGITVREPAVIELGRTLSSKLPGAFGVLNFQCFYDKASGAINIIEINPRFGGGYPLAWQAGGRYAQWLLEELLDRPSTATFDGWQDGLVMLRYDAAVFVTAAQAGLQERG